MKAWCQIHRTFISSFAQHADAGEFFQSRRLAALSRNPFYKTTVSALKLYPHVASTRMIAPLPKLSPPLMILLRQKFLHRKRHTRHCFAQSNRDSFNNHGTTINPARSAAARKR